MKNEKVLSVIIAIITNPLKTMNTFQDIPLPHGEPFKKQWSEWIEYRKEIKKPLKSQKSITGCLNQFWLVSEEVSIKMIQQSINNQWQGIFPLKKDLTQKGETDATYKEPTKTKVSPYQAPEFSRAEGIQHLRDKLKRNYESGGFILDYGDVYTTLLQKFMDIPSEVGFKIHQDEVTEASRKRNRFEDKYSGNVASNVRDARLNWQLDFWRKEKRNISLEI